MSIVEVCIGNAGNLQLEAYLDTIIKYALPINFPLNNVWKLQIFKGSSVFVLLEDKGEADKLSKVEIKAILSRDNVN